MNILLVEDNDLDVEFMQRGLKKTGATGELIRARDGIEALELLKRDAATHDLPRPWVILLDINMPRMNGHEFLQALRRDPEISDARVFVFTTSASAKDIETAYANQASGYVVKPSGSAEMTRILNGLQRFWEICEDKTCPQGGASAV